MDSKTTKLLFSLLRSAITSVKLSESEKAQFSTEQMQYMVNVSKKHDILHLLAWSLKLNNIKVENDLELKKSLSLAVYRYEKINTQYTIICQVLEDAQIPFIPLKGSVIRKYYPEGWMRTSSDIDILIHEEDIEKACALFMENHNYSNMKKSLHDVAFFSADNVHVELHYDLIEDGRINNSYTVMKSVWPSSSLREGYQYLYDMSDEMFYFYHVAHMAKHFKGGGCGIRSFIDLWFLNNLENADYVKREKLLIDGGLLNFAKTATELSKVWFENAEPTQSCQQMENFILHGGVYGTPANIHKVSAVQGENKAKSFFKLVFPPYKSMVKLFPMLNKCPILLPYYHVKRWSKVFDKRKRASAKNQINMVSSISKQEINSLTELFDHLGLTE